ncbi:MAG: hypothetical protein JXB46_05165 [Candidatus Eisenbacteria bacterium]|nr:hypothetical protein [Candidatus Eisenbacteria bacterium]
MSRIAFIGDRDSIWGFRAFGVAVYPIASAEEAREALDEAIRDGHLVVFLTEDVYEACGEQVAEYRELALPTLTVLPSVTGSRGIAATQIHQAVSSAIGVDILGEPGGDGS